jgi:hypothetical protein
VNSLIRLAAVAMAVAVIAAGPTNAGACDRQPLRTVARGVVSVATAPVRVARNAVDGVRANVAERRYCRAVGSVGSPAVASDYRPEAREVFVSDPPFPATVAANPTCSGPGCPQPQRFFGYGRAVYPFK